MTSHLSVSVVFLAGGTGTRMGQSIPKQFLLLNEKPVFYYSLELFLSIPEIKEIIIVCDDAYRTFFTDIPVQGKTIRFANPGSRRQDSVYNGLMQADPQADLICTHDSARPLIDQPLVMRVIDAAYKYGAATVGMPVAFTVKQSNAQQFVSCTMDRSTLWEIQTPQVIRPDLFHEGFRIANEKNLTVTDDVSLVELLQKEVKLVEGSPHNLKITFPKDLELASLILKK